MTDELETVLADRGKRYGSFMAVSETAQALKSVMHGTKGWNQLSADQCEALDNVQTKIARILNGDPDWRDSWLDMSGYPKLIADRLVSE